MMKRDRVIFALPRTTRQATLELSNDGHQAPTDASHNGALIRFRGLKVTLWMSRLRCTWPASEGRADNHRVRGYPTD